MSNQTSNKGRAGDLPPSHAALRRLADLLAGDPTVCGIARPTRVPGSYNSKNDEWREVANVVTRKGGYTLIQLEKWLTKATPVLTRVNGNRAGVG